MACMVAAVFTMTPVAAEESENWVVVNIETPGNLGVEILYQADKLADVTHLRVSGEINSTDWATIKNLSNIQVIDLENAVTEVVPDGAFSDRTTLVSITLPNTIKSIEDWAFSKTSLDEVIFPASLESIGHNSFDNSKVKNVTFAEGNKLKRIGSRVFYNCGSLQNVTFSTEAEITEIPDEAFNWCSKLSSINLPESVTSIGYWAFHTAPFSHIELPGNLKIIGVNAFRSTQLLSVIIPQSVNYIGSEAFYNCNEMLEIELPTSVHSLQPKTFGLCDKLNKLICKSVTPPAVDRAFETIDISQITLVVPDFAVHHYKLDSYWLQFGNIEGGAKSDYWDINGTVSLNNEHRMEGTPSITMQTGGCLNVLGNAAMPVDQFKMYYNHRGDWNGQVRGWNAYGHSQLINNSPLMTANKTEVSYSIYGNNWYFISLPFDVKVDDICHSDSTAEYAVRYYDGAERATANATGNSWKDVPAGTVIKPGTGIIFQSNKGGDIIFPCADDGRNTIFNPNSVTMELAANTAESSAHSGWNFIANPYPCYYDMYYAMLSCPITVYNPDNGNYVAYSLIDDDVVLWPNRPFFIQASDDVNEIVFSNSGRQFSSEISRPSGAPSQSDKATRALFNISLSCNGLTDDTRVVINPEATQDYECNRDASKFFSENPEIPQVYTISSGEEYLAINERDEADGAVRLGFYAPIAGEMSLTLTRIDGEASLFDAGTKETTVLDEGAAYNFSVSEPGFDNGRFTLILNAPGTTGVNGISAEGAAAVTVDGNIIRVANAAGKDVVICSADGKVYVKETAAADRMEYAMPCGLYIVKAGAASTKCLIK